MTVNELDDDAARSRSRFGDILSYDSALGAEGRPAGCCLQHKHPPLVVQAAPTAAPARPAIRRSPPRSHTERSSLQLNALAPANDRSARPSEANTKTRTVATFATRVQSNMSPMPVLPGPRRSQGRGLMCVVPSRLL